MTPEEALQFIGENDYSVRVQKYGRLTNLRDCEPSLWEFLGVRKDQLWPQSGPALKVCDFPFDVWRCEIGFGRPAAARKTGYGRSFMEAVEAARDSSG